MAHYDRCCCIVVLIYIFSYNFLSFCTDEGTSKTFACARPLVGQFVAIQLVGVEGSLSLCEVEVFSNDGKQFEYGVTKLSLSLFLCVEIYCRPFIQQTSHPNVAPFQI